MPRCASLRPKELEVQRAREMLQQAAPRRVLLPERGVALALADWGGDGPLALLHHATGFCKGIWAPIALQLRQRFRVIALDARGHGDSSKPDPAAPDSYHWDHFALDLLDLARILAPEHGGRVALGIGHSFGGTTMLGAASRQAGLFERLVLVDAVIPPPPGQAQANAERSTATRGSTGERARGRSMVEAARRRRSQWPNRNAARQRWAQRSIFSSWTPEALDLYALDGLREREDGSVALKCPGEVEAAVFANVLSVDVMPMAQRVQAQTLWLWASQGDFSRAQYDSLAARMASARVETLEASHLVTMEQPDLVAQAALRFCAEGA